MIPKVLTKLVDGKAQRLSGEELEEATKTYGDTLREEGENLNTLTDLRKRLTELECEMNHADSEEIYDTLMKEYDNVKEQFKSVRYKDTRKYSDDMKSWKISFSNHLALFKCSNANASSNMAIDILIAYEQSSTRSLEFQDLKNARTVRLILDNFVNRVDTLKWSSKRKYLTMFDTFMKFLLLDPESPERSDSETADEKILRSLLYREVKEEIGNATKLINRSSGKDRIRAKFYQVTRISRSQKCSNSETNIRQLCQQC